MSFTGSHKPVYNKEDYSGKLKKTKQASWSVNCILGIPSFIGLSTGFPKEEQEKETKEMKGFAAPEKE
jgi:hypothetical protein